MPLVILEKENGIGTLTINNPPANALSAGVLTELTGALRELAADDSVRVMVIQSRSPKFFVAGADIKEFTQLRDAREAEALARRGQEITMEIVRLPKPVIAAIGGFALGGGCELAMACDIRVASPEAKFGQPEINLGIIPGYGGTQRLARLIGESRAKLLNFTGDNIAGEEAYRLGLVDVPAPTGEANQSARALAEKIAAKPPVALKLIKRAVHEGLQGPLEQGLALEARLFGEVFVTDDAGEGVAAFLEKRTARWKGK